MRLFVINPHTDDGELGVGGTTARYLEAGANVHYIILSVPRPELEEECVSSINSFKIKDNGIHLHLYRFERRNFLDVRQEILQTLYSLNEKLQPDLVFTPSTHDIHQDHQVATSEAIRAFKHASILGYILPWNNKIIVEDAFIPFEERHLQAKITALTHYNSQRRLGRFYFQPDYTRFEAYVRGARFDKPYAEAFEAIRIIM